MTYDEFLHDDKTQSAVIRKFEVTGKAARARNPAGIQSPTNLSNSPM